MKRIAATSVMCILIFIISTACQPITLSSDRATSKPKETIIEPTGLPTIPPNSVEAPTPNSDVSPTLASIPTTGSIKGKLGYPSENIPELHIVAFLFGTDTFFTIDTETNQSTYQIDGLVEGNYHVVAYTKGSESITAGLSGGYTQAVTCGMQESCTDHTLVDVAVVAGQVVENVDLLDWLIPLPPSPIPGEAVQGLITGQLSYPSQFIPPMKVAAFRVGDGQIYTMMTQMNQGIFALPVPAGTYHVVAYTGGGPDVPAGLTGGYSWSVPCGLSIICTNHNLIDVIVVQGSVTSGIDPGDFYAPEGSFPPAP
jgi:hypothetical protein